MRGLLNRTRQACMHASQIVWRTTGERAQSYLPTTLSMKEYERLPPEPPAYSSAIRAASLKMDTNIARVSLPVWVFWLDGW